MPLKSCIPNYDFKHFVASIMSLLIWFRRLVMVIFVPKKSLLGFADMVGIDSISTAILLKIGYVFCCVSSSHYVMALMNPYTRLDLQ